MKYNLCTSLHKKFLFLAIIFSAVLAGLKPSPAKAQTDWETIAAAEREAWKYSKEGDNYPPAESAPSPHFPTQYHEFAGMFKPFIGQEYDLKDVFISQDRITLHQYVVRAFELIFEKHGNRPIPSIIKDLVVPLVALADDIKVQNFNWFVNDRPTLPPRPPGTTSEKLKLALETIGLLDRLYPRAVWQFPKGTLVSSIRANTDLFFKGLSSHRGASLTDIFILSILSDPILADAILIYPREVSARTITQRADQLLGSKTTPSLAYNNKARALAAERVPWKDLGMQHYNGFKGFFPWATMGLAENYYTHREMYAFAEFTPVIGTMLSVVDGLLTMYEGKDYYGAPTNRVWTGAFLALDAIDLAFTGGTVGAAAVKPAKFAKLSLLTKELKLANFPKTRDGSLLMLSKLRRGLSEAMESPGVAQACVFVRGAGALTTRAYSGSGQLSSAASKFPDVRVLQNCTKGTIDTSQNIILDTNLLMPLVTWRNHRAKVIARLKELFPKRATLTGKELISYIQLERLYVTGKVLDIDYSDHTLVIAETVLREGRANYAAHLDKLELKDVNFYPDIFEDLLDKQLGLRKGLMLKPTQIPGTDGADDYSTLLAKFGVGEEVGQSKAHKGTGDREILFDITFADRVGYADSNLFRQVWPLFATNDKATFAGTALLGIDPGKIPGKIPNLFDKSQTASFATAFFGKVAGVNLNFTESRIIAAFNEQIRLGNEMVIKHFQQPISSLANHGMRDVANLPMKARLVPTNCQELNHAINGLDSTQEIKKELYKKILKDVETGKFTESAN